MFSVASSKLYDLDSHVYLQGLGIIEDLLEFLFNLLLPIFDLLVSSFCSKYKILFDLFFEFFHKRTCLDQYLLERFLKPQIFKYQHF